MTGKRNFLWVLAAAIISPLLLAGCLPDAEESLGDPPRLVRVQLVFADARRVWPDFVVAPKF